MKKIIATKTLLIFKSFFLLVIFISGGSAQEQTTETNSWNLTGQEILFEITDYKGKYAPGIYSWNPSDAYFSSLKLLISRGKKPTWSLHHKKIIYIFNGDLWIADREGNKAALNPSFPSSLMASEDSPVVWNWDGSFTLTMRSEIWGSRVYVGYNVEDKAISVLRSQYSPLFENAVSGFWPIIPLKEIRKINSPDADNSYRWQDFMATNNATFSPDGNFVLTEVYPAAPMDVERASSHIIVYEFFKWSGDKVKDDEKTAQIRSQFSTEISIPPINPFGRRLTNIIGDESELKPLYAPDGEWIAFTILDTKQGYMVPAVIKATEKSTAFLIVAGTKKQSNFELKGGWQPVPDIKAQNTSLKNIEVRKSIDKTAEEWSLDGKYLWIRQGREGIFVAKHESGKWLTRQVVQTTGGEFGILQSSFNESRVAWIEDSGDLRKIRILNILDSEIMKKTSVKLPSGLDVTWMDW